jgi:hypothetical protein
MKKEYVIFNQRLAGYLMMNGFVLKHMEKSDRNNKNIFFFNESEELFNKIKEFKITIQNN